VPEIDWQVGHSIPGAKGMTTRAFVKDGALMLNLDAPTEGNPNQTNIFEMAHSGTEGE
jgi:hypothetical protein